MESTPILDAARAVIEQQAKAVADRAAAVKSLLAARDELAARYVAARTEMADALAALGYKRGRTRKAKGAA